MRRRGSAQRDAHGFERSLEIAKRSDPVGGSTQAGTSGCIDSGWRQDGREAQTPPLRARDRSLLNGSVPNSPDLNDYPGRINFDHRLGVWLERWRWWCTQRKPLWRINLTLHMAELIIERWAICADFARTCCHACRWNDLPLHTYSLTSGAQVPSSHTFGIFRHGWTNRRSLGLDVVRRSRLHVVEELARGTRRLVVWRIPDDNLVPLFVGDVAQDARSLEEKPRRSQEQDRIDQSQYRDA